MVEQSQGGDRTANPLESFLTAANLLVDNAFAALDRIAIRRQGRRAEED